ncbi:hypothetical protein ASE82_11685 [Sphingomonas sp. Leaf230]|uniref:hypothetical protein n=1 Tax=Sphingomonas sp. Leaf230 TaxID=1735694 RepID=UPI0006FFBDC6|nr:hypothetical protein [Sphingomonas sp. Leaf230]KQN01936.1 hypothetical protein ASE82_11685 [Sphingomonas sp. Leaf230]
MPVSLVTIDPSITAADASQPRVPVDLFNQALCAFDGDGIVNNVLWAGGISGTSPIEGVSGQLCKAPFTTPTNLPLISANDANMPAVLPPNLPLASPTFNMPVSSGRGVRMPLANFTSSWSMAFITYWDGVTNIGGIWAAAASDANVQKAVVWGAPGGLRMGQTYTPHLFEDTRPWKVGPNLVLICFDPVKRQFASYVNSQRGLESLVDVGANPAPAVAAGDRWYMGMAPSGSPASPGFRGPSWATFADSLHHNPKLASRRRALIQAAADTYGITLG